MLNNGDLDPELNFYNDFMLSDSQYLTASELSSAMSATTITDFSILHINCRSINKHFDHILSLIDQLKFVLPIIAVTETWTTKKSYDVITSKKIQCRQEISV